MSDTDLEPLEDFRERARTYIQENIPPIGAGQPGGASMRAGDDDEAELADVAHQRKLQRLLFDGGLAGIIVPKEYGGQGLTPAHAEVLNEEMAGYQYPSRLQVPGMQPCMTVILDFGTEEQKQRHVRAILTGEEIWMQMLSEPSGGSDAAGAQTTAVRDGEEWIINGSKIWTTGAWWSDWALLLARTNPDVPKHRGLTVFLVPFDIPGLEMHRIELLNGSKEFCQEFLTDVRIPDANRVGDVDDGWTVGTRWMYYERSFSTSPYCLRPPGGMFGGEGGGRRGGGSGLFGLARRAGRAGDRAAREMVGEAHALSLASGELMKRVPQAMMTGKMTDQAASLIKLAGCLSGRRSATISWELAGSAAGAWSDDEADLGMRGAAYLSRQTGEIGGGTTEMARNVVAERVLGMPRERTVDRDTPFREIPKGPPAK